MVEWSYASAWSKRSARLTTSRLDMSVAATIVLMIPCLSSIVTARKTTKVRDLDVIYIATSQVSRDPLHARRSLSTTNRNRSLISYLVSLLAYLNSSLFYIHFYKQRSSFLSLQIPFPSRPIHSEVVPILIPCLSQSSNRPIASCS